MDKESMMKDFTFYYKNASQNLSLATGTTQLDIIQTLRILFQIPASKRLLFLGSEGHPVVLSSALPAGIKLTIIDEDYQVASINAPLNSGKWKWVQSQGGIKIDDYSYKSNPESKTTLYGDIKITEGKHWWKIQLKEIFCCQDIGITQGNLDHSFWKSKPETYGTAIGFPDYFPGEQTGPGWTNCNSLKWVNHTFICYLDMGKGKFVIINENLKRLITDIKVTFTPAIPFFHSNKHDNQVTLVDAGQGELQAEMMSLIPKEP